MTSDQANEIREFLISQLNENEYNDIVAEVNTRLEEDYGERAFERNPISVLTFFLVESIEVLENLSNRNFGSLISRFNQIISGENKIGRISVELLNQGKSVYFDLKDLPDYKNIIIDFRDILNQIRSDN